MDPLLQPLSSNILTKLFLSDDLTNEFIKNKDYSSNQNVINVATVLLSYYENMNGVNKMLSDYTAMVTNATLSPQKKADLELRIQLLTYVSKQKEEIEKKERK